MVARSDSAGLVKLAESIAEYAWDNSSLLLLNTRSENPGFGPYVVREGNRRLTAIKGIQSPDMFEGVLNPVEMRRLRLASARASLPSVIPALVFGSDEESDLLRRIELRHGGENDGAGVRPWDVRARTRALGGQDAPAVSLLDWLESAEDYPDSSTIAPTNLTRLLSTPEIRIALGIVLRGGKLVIPFGPEFSPGALKRLLAFMLDPDFTVDKIRTSELRKSLASDLAHHREINSSGSETADASPGSTSPAPEHEPSSSSANQQNDSEEANRNIKAAEYSHSIREDESENSDHGNDLNTSTNRTRPRKNLVPSDFPSGVGSIRVNEILKQGKKLKLEEMPAVCGIALRVIVELIVDEYRSRLTPAPNDIQKLKDKILDVATRLESGGHLTSSQKDGVEAVANSTNYGFTNVVTLHSYVHSLHAPVNGNDIRNHWDYLDTFLRKAWTNLP